MPSFFACWRERNSMKRDALDNSSLSSPFLLGELCAYWPIDRNKARFEQLGALYRVLDWMMRGQLRGVSVGGLRDNAVRQALAREALYVALVDGHSALPRYELQEGGSHCPLHLFGGGASFDGLGALDRARTLAGGAMKLPPGPLTLARYRQYVQAIVRDQRWEMEEFCYGRMQRHEAWASIPLARIHLSHAPKNALLRAALVGRCDCTEGGGDLGPSAERLDTSAVVLSLMQAVAETCFPLRIDAWLAVMGSPGGNQHPRVTISQGDANIEFSSIDAGTRGALVDALCQALRSAPHIIVDFATFSGALGCRGPSHDIRRLFRPRANEPREPRRGGDTFGGVAGIRGHSRFADQELSPKVQGRLFGIGEQGGGSGLSAASSYALSWGVELLTRWLDEKPANSKPRF
jgi:hypothetical protein